MITSSVVAFMLLILQLPTSSLQGRPSGKNVATRGRAYRPYLPADLDLNKTPLRELADMRPENHRTSEGDLYRVYFANHPDVKKINLHESKTALTAKKLVDLTADGTYDTGSKFKMNASIKTLLDETPFKNNEHRQKLISDYKGARFIASKRFGRQMYESRHTKEELARKRRESYHRLEAETGRGHNRGHDRGVGLAHQVLNKPLSFHLDKDGVGPSAREAETRVRGMSHLYTSELYLSRELDRYLKDKKVSPEDLHVIMGQRYKHVQDKTATKKPRRTKVQTPLVPEAFPSLPSSSGSRSSQHRAVSPISSPSHPLPPLHPQTKSVDPHDTSEWAWLHEMDLS